MCGCDTSGFASVLNASQLQNFVQDANKDRVLLNLLNQWTKNPTDRIANRVNKRLDTLKSVYLTQLPNKIDPSNLSLAVTLSSPKCTTNFLSKDTDLNVINVIQKKVKKTIKDNEGYSPFISGNISIKKSDVNVARQGKATLSSMIIMCIQYASNTDYVYDALIHNIEQAIK